MLNLSFEISNHAVVKRFLAEMPERLNDVITEASNKAITRLKAVGVKALPEHWNIPKEQVKDKWSTTRAKAGDEAPTAFATVKSGMVGLFQFTPHPSAIMGGKTTGGVSVMIGGKSEQFKHAFVAQMASGHKGIFQRTGRFATTPGPRGGTRREVISEVFGLSHPQMAEDVGKQRIPPELAEEAQRVFENAFIGGCATWLAAKGAK